MKKCITNKYGVYYGTVGEQVPNSKYRVGDIVIWRGIKRDVFGAAVVVRDGKKGYGLHGWLGTDIRNKDNKFYEVHDIIVPAGKVDDAMLAYNSKGVLFTKELPPAKKLTKAEIEELLGFRIEIVEDKEESVTVSVDDSEMEEVDQLFEQLFEGDEPQSLEEALEELQAEEEEEDLSECHCDVCSLRRELEKAIKEGKSPMGAILKVVKENARQNSNG